MIDARVEALIKEANATIWTLTETISRRRLPRDVDFEHWIRALDSARDKLAQARKTYNENETET